MLNFKNDKLEQARNQILEQTKKSVTKAGGEGQSLSQAELKKRNTELKDTQVAVQEGSKLFEIEISNPFFSGPQTIVLADLTAPKTVNK